MATPYARAVRIKISAYFNLSLKRPSDIDEWRRWLATEGSILTRLGDHAVALVGHTPDRFFVRSSRGRGWDDS